MDDLKQKVGKILLALLAPVLCFLGVELVLRMINVGYDPHFLIQHTIQGVPHWIENEKFGWRFFHPAIARTPEPISLPVKKGSDEFRVLLLGGSAAQGDPAPEFGAARMLEVMLRDALPAKKVTVINAAMTAINSHVVKVIARDAQVLEPDVVIIYMGNNEVIGPYGPASATYPWQRSDLWVRLHTRLTGTRTGQLLQSLMQGLTPLNFQEWKGMEMFLDQRLAIHDERLNDTYQGFVANLNSIAEESIRRQCPIFLNTIAVNLESLGPFAVDEAGEGERLFLTGRTDRDVQLLKEARDLDELRFRADSKINKLIKGLAEQYVGVDLVDAEYSFQDTAGFESFVDHVHFNWAGNLQLAKIWLGHIAESLDFELLPQQELNKDLRVRLGWDEVEEHKVYQLVLERWRHAPFIHSVGWPDALRHLSSLSVTKPIASSATTPLFPNDYYGRMRGVNRSVRDGNLKQAINEMLHIRERWPVDREAIVLQAKILGQSGRLREADDLLQAYDYLFAGRPGKQHIQLANEWLAVGKLEQAQKWFDLASRSTHQKAEVALGRGMLQSTKGDLNSAISRFKQALTLDPMQLQARNNLVALWPSMGEGELKEAIKLGAELVSLDPNHAEYRYNYGLALLKGNRGGDAAAEFISALQIRPDFWPAARELAQIYLRLEQWESMLRVTELFDQLIPEDNDLLQLRGFAHARLGHVEEAKDALNQVMD